MHNALRPVDATPLAVFRVILGVTFWCWAGSYLAHDHWRIFFHQPIVLFKYAGFEWVRLWPGEGIWWHFVAVRLAAVLLVIGAFTRLSALLLAAGMAYVLLVERQIYNNHDYLLACTALLCVFLPCSRALSVDRWLWQRRPRRPPTMRLWHWWLLRFQLGLPYVFGGIAKLDADWLAGQPAGLFLQAREQPPILGPLFALPQAPFVMAYGGLLFDLLVVPALMWRPTRWFAVAAAMAFHLTNATIFHIGVFPWFMLATLYVFFPVDWLPRQIERMAREFARIRGRVRDRRAGATAVADTAISVSGERDPVAEQAKRPPRQGSHRVQRLALSAALVYVAVQLALPIRPWVLPGNPSWNERGQRFAWRMMLRHKDCLLWYKIETDQDYLFVPASFVMTANQLRRAGRDPELVRQAAIKLQALAAELGQPDCRVHAWHLVSLNGRPPRPLVDPRVDLTRARRGWFQDPWVQQDPGPLPEQPWRLPFDRWWSSVETPPGFEPLARYRPGQALALFEQMRERARSSPTEQVK